MNHKHLHDLAKFGAGLVLGDFLAWWWLATHNGLPARFLGMTFNSSVLMPGMIFDAALFIILVHYGWHLGRTPALRNRTYFLAVGIVFGIVALAHLLRLFAGTELVIASWVVPLWLSWIGTAATAYLSYMSFRLAVTKK